MNHLRIWILCFKRAITSLPSKISFWDFIFVGKIVLTDEDVEYDMTMCHHYWWLLSQHLILLLRDTFSMTTLKWHERSLEMHSFNHWNSVSRGKSRGRAWCKIFKTNSFDNISHEGQRKSTSREMGIRDKVTMKCQAKFITLAHLSSLN